MKRFIKILMSLILIFTLSSCKKEDDFRKIILQGIDKIEIPEEVTKDLDFPTSLKVSGYKVNFTYETSSDVINTNGQINPGVEDIPVTITITGELKGYQETKEFEVTLKKESTTIDHIDEKTNKKILDELNGIVETKFEAYMKSNYADRVIKFAVYAGSDALVQTMVESKIINDPCYFEIVDYVYDDYYKENRIVYRDEEGTLVKYQNQEDGIYKRTLSTEDKNTFEFRNENDKISFDLPTDKINVSKYEDTYKIKARVIDMKSIANLDEYIKACKEAGLDEDFVNNMVFNVEVDVNGDYIDVQTRCITEYIYNGKKIPIVSMIGLFYSYEEFEEYNLDERNNVEKPQSIAEITKTTKEKEEINLCAGKQYFRYNFKNGFYAINNGNFLLDVEYELYDSNKNKIELPKIKEFPENCMNYYFNIPSDGIYYMSFKVDFYRKIWVERLDYETYVDINNPENILGSHQGLIEGKYDKAYFIYKGISKAIIKITNNSNNALAIEYLDNDRSAKRVSQLNANGFGYLLVEPSAPILLAGVNDEKINYDISVEIFNDEYATSTDISSMPKLTTDWSNYFLVGENTRSKYFVIDVKEKGIYTIKHQTINGNDIAMNHKVVDTNGKEISCVLNQWDSYVLTPGQYTIQYISNHEIMEIKTKYEYDSTDSKKVSVTLPNLENKDSYLKDQRSINSQVIKYYFTLKEDSIIIFENKKIRIYDTNGQIVSLEQQNLEEHGMSAQKFKAGSYYFIYVDFIIGSKMEIAINNKTTLPVFDGVGTIIKLGESITLDSNEDIKYYSITINEDGIYHITSSMTFISFYLYDKDYKMVGSLSMSYDPTYYNFKLTKGTYYLVIESNGTTFSFQQGEYK